jgi:threonine dehydrogenase-like Zn-dependent dehydrogenase
MFAAARGADVHLLGATATSLDFARSLGFTQVWTRETLPDEPFDAIVDATNAADLPAFAIDRVEPGGRVVFIGISGEPSLVDTRRAVLKDLTLVGILSASGGLAETIEAYASRAVDPRPLVAETVGLDAAADVLAGTRRSAAPKIHIDPRV